MVTVQVDKIDENDPTALCRHYPGQVQEQTCYIILDLADGRFTAEFDPNIGRTKPESVLNGRIRRYRIPCLWAEAANELLDRLTPLAGQLLADSEIVWDGRCSVARLGERGTAAEHEIRETCEEIEAEAGSGYAMFSVLPEHHFAGAKNAELIEGWGITSRTTDARLAEIAANEQKQALDDGGTILYQMEEFLRGLREQVRRATTECP